MTEQTTHPPTRDDVATYAVRRLIEAVLTGTHLEQLDAAASAAACLPGLTTDSDVYRRAVTAWSALNRLDRIAGGE